MLNLYKQSGESFWFRCNPSRGEAEWGRGAGGGGGEEGKEWEQREEGECLGFGHGLLW